MSNDGFQLRINPQAGRIRLFENQAIAPSAASGVGVQVAARDESGRRGDTTSLTNGFGRLTLQRGSKQPFDTEVRTN